MYISALHCRLTVYRTGCVGSGSGSDAERMIVLGVSSIRYVIYVRSVM